MRHTCPNLFDGRTVASIDEGLPLLVMRGVAEALRRTRRPPRPVPSTQVTRGALGTGTMPSMPFRFRGIDHVQLAAPAGCEAQARRFFAGLLGWQEIDKPAPLQARGGLWFRCGAHQVHVGVQQPFTPATKAHPAFEVLGLDALRAHLGAHRVPITEDHARAEEGVARFYAVDPFGNRLEFMQRATGTGPAA